MKEHIWKPADGVYDGWCIQITQQNEPGEEFAYRMVPVLMKTTQNGTRHMRRITTLQSAKGMYRMSAAHPVTILSPTFLDGF